MQRRRRRTRSRWERGKEFGSSIYPDEPMNYLLRSSSMSTARSMNSQPLKLMENHDLMITVDFRFLGEEDQSRHV